MAFDLTAMSFGELYPLYLAKVQRKGRSEAELREVLSWLLGQEDLEALHPQSLGQLFSQGSLRPEAKLIRGSVCGVRVEDISDPVMWGIRCADKLVDELAQGKPLAAIKRS